MVDDTLPTGGATEGAEPVVLTARKKDDETPDKK